MPPFKIRDVLQESLKGLHGTSSSKRLLGVTAGFVFEFSCLVGVMVTLWCNQWDYLIQIIAILGTYSATLLGAGLLEKPTHASLKERSERKAPTHPSPTSDC